MHVEQAGTGFDFRVLVSLGTIDTDAMQVQLYAAASEDAAIEPIPMERGAEVIRGTFTYHAHVEAHRPPQDCTPRVLPYHPAASIPLEAEQICWYTR